MYIYKDTYIKTIPVPNGLKVKLHIRTVISFSYTNPYKAEKHMSLNKNATCKAEKHWKVKIAVISMTGSMPLRKNILI